MGGLAADPPLMSYLSCHDIHYSCQGRPSELPDPLPSLNSNSHPKVRKCWAKRPGNQVQHVQYAGGARSPRAHDEDGWSAIRGRASGGGFRTEAGLRDARWV